MDVDTKLWEIATEAALEVEFITTGKELYLYTRAIYYAMEWGWGEQIKERDVNSSTECH